MRVALTASCLLFLAGYSAATAAADTLWRDQSTESILAAGPRLTAPLKARSFELDLAGLGSVLDALPAEGDNAKARPALTLPMPDGTALEFRLWRTEVMHPDLAARYPQIRTFAGVAADGSSGRFDVGPHGFHGMVFTARGTVYIDPWSHQDIGHYQAYFKRDLPLQARGEDVVLGERVQRAAADDVKAGVSIGTDLRTYRLALATTGEYARFHSPSGDKTVVLAELVNVTNRVTGVYEREVGVRLQLIANEDKIIFVDAATDPYANANGGSMVNKNTTELNTRIGSANYDIGHVASTGGGGIAGLGVVCLNSQKGAGVTGLGSPVGDAYYIDYVAHEMGHQFGGDHTFNSVSGSCGGGNRNGPTAYEPGSGVTIMAYAGICGADDLAPHSIDTFHSASFDEIVAYTRTGSGKNCPVVTASGNHAPVAHAPTGGFTIPFKTPFELTGSATDADGDALTYQWEGFDKGAGGSAEHPDAAAPLFRSFLPTASPTRIFPRLQNLLANSHTIGERLPEVARQLHFRLVVRDNHVAPSSGGVGSADLKFSVTDAAGPFLVTAPNTAASLTGGQALNVTWDVAGTTAAPVSCAAVDIRFSANGGTSFPTMLAAATPNDGAQSVTLPNVDAAGARIKVKCSDNVFFDISDADFSVTHAGGPEPFHFDDVSDAPGDTITLSNQITVTGGGGTISIAGTGASFRINSGAYTHTTTTVAAGDKVRLRLKSGPLGGVTRAATLTIGTQSDQWTVTTASGSDSTPDAPVFVDVEGATASQAYRSNEITITGIDAPAGISITGSTATYQVNRGAFTADPGTVHAGDKVRLRMFAPATAAHTRTANVTVGGVVVHWRVSTP